MPRLKMVLAISTAIVLAHLGAARWLIAGCVLAVVVSAAVDVVYRYLEDRATHPVAGLWSLSAQRECNTAPVTPRR
jgi:hypothetical protein